MPLTFAHPSVVLPLFRTPFVPAALVAGSMSPDLPYFLGATGTAVTAQSWYEPFFNATTSHSPLGALTVSLPMAPRTQSGSGRRVNNAASPSPSSRSTGRTVSFART